MAIEGNYFKAMHQSGWSSFWKFHWSEIPLTFCLPGRIFTKCNLIRWLRGFQPITVRMTFQIIDEACLATPTSNELLVWSSSGHFTRAFTMRVTCMKLDWCIIPCTTEFYRDRRLNRDSPGQTGTYARSSNKVTSTKCQIWVLHEQLQCAIALVSDAQIKSKLSLAPKSWLSRNDSKTLYKTSRHLPC